MAGQLLTVEVGRDDDGATVIACDGEIDLSSVGMLEEAIAWSMTADLQILRIDARAVSFVDSTGVKCFLTAAVRCDELGVDFHVLGSAHVAHILEICGIAELLGEPIRNGDSPTSMDTLTDAVYGAIRQSNDLRSPPVEKSTTP
jgi:anti-anti-sigma factor